ncbi:MAG TPA: glycoside hydrolase [Chloroflexota bacterium]
MKLTVIGGAGVRSPLLMPALARRQGAIDLRQVVLVDRDEAKLEVMGPLCRYSAQRAGGEFEVAWTADARDALPGSSAVITTIRPGAEAGRVADERIALEHGVLAQETTGAGGFAMALRTIPAVTEIARQMQELCPDAWLLNFTNPAGLVVQALVTSFPDLKIVGICDTPTSMRRQVAAAFGRTAPEISVRFFGLNHLSWMAEATVDGENLVPRLLEDPALTSRLPELALFDRPLLQMLGMLPNEYLYFYYYRDRATANIGAAAETRGRQVQRLSGKLLRDLREIDPARRPEAAWDRYMRYLDSRHGTYLAMESGRDTERDAPPEKEEQGDEGEGYGGVAIDILATAAGGESELVVNVPNQGAIPGMSADDVVEVACRCDSAGLHPLALDTVPEDELLLMQAVKRYERLTVEAVATHSRERAVEALMVHPLVGSYTAAQSLVDAYLAEHRQDVGDWEG